VTRKARIHSHAISKQKMKVERPAMRMSAALITVATLTLFASLASAQSNQVMLIIDSSRSMWGHIEGVNKVVHARSALERFFKQYEDKFWLGLMAYGHQNKASCEDFQVLKQISDFDADSYASAVKAIAPKGSTPIAAALDAAVQSMAQQTGTKHIVLLSDGLDNCEGDPCARAESLAQTVPQLTLHAITFDRPDKLQKLAKLSCIAEPSDGIFKAASSPKQLNSALRAVAERINAPSTKTRPAIAENIDPTAPVPIKLTAYLSGDDSRVERGLTWRVFSGRAGDDGRYKLLHELRNARPDFKLKPGAYFVHVSWGLAHATKRLEVVPGQPAHEQVVLKAGAVRLTARQASGAPIDDDSISFDIFSDETDQFGNREKIIADAQSGQAIRMNSGSYYVVSQYGESNAIIESKVEVKPGKLSEVILIHDASKVTFRLAARRGGEAIADTRWTIKTLDGKVVERSAGAFPTHVLTAGKYRVEAEHNGRLFADEFELAGGGARQIEVLMR